MSLLVERPEHLLGLNAFDTASIAGRPYERSSAVSTPSVSPRRQALETDA
jgi:hypothetical protein